MTHDPLCPIHEVAEAADDVPLDGRPWEYLFCECELIAKVRKDMLAKCIALVAETYRESPKTLSDDEAHELSVDALRALQEKP